MRLTAALLFLTLPAFAAPPTTCTQNDPYSRALCAYQQRKFIEAEKLFLAVSSNSNDPKATASLYFLGRAAMKQGRYEDASGMFIRIYEDAPGFYREWNCDFLLGECRRALGKS